jgi:hypothetical protein
MSSSSKTSKSFRHGDPVMLAAWVVVVGGVLVMAIKQSKITRECI